MNAQADFFAALNRAIALYHAASVRGDTLAARYYAASVRALLSPSRPFLGEEEPCPASTSAG
jgi:hypothetical protein